MKTEIEIKIQITEIQEEKLVSWLDENSKNNGITYQVEHYLNNPRTSFIFISSEGYRDSRDFLRVRFSSKGDSLCLKHWHLDKNTGSLTHCDEYESNIQNGEDVLKLFRAIGYTDEVIIKKSRTTYTTAKFEISVDRVENLGRFIEIELTQEMGTVQSGLHLIYEFLKSLGITQFKKMERGYVSMMWNPDQNFGEIITLS